MNSSKGPQIELFVELTYCHFAANDFRMLSRIGYSRYRYRPVEYRAPKMSALKSYLFSINYDGLNH